MKPCKQSEVDFYESSRSHHEFATYIPAYLGTLALGEGNPAQAAGTIALPAQTSPELPPTATFGSEAVIEAQWTPSNGGKIQTDLAIVLENVHFGFKKPNPLDVKLGSRLWADDAPPAKRARLDKAAEETTSKPLGFRIAGMKAYQGGGSENHPGVNLEGYKVFDKTYGRALNVDNVRQGFEDYFLLPRGSKAAGGVRKVMRRFVDDLHGLAKAIENEECRIYSASLLFVYEGDAAALDAAFVREKEILASLKDRSDVDGRDPTNGAGSAAGVKVDEGEDDDGSGEDDEIKFPAISRLKLIDFAHAQWTPGQGPDANVLHGLRNVAKMIADLAG